MKLDEPVTQAMLDESRRIEERAERAYVQCPRWRIFKSHELLVRALKADLAHRQLLLRRNMQLLAKVTAELAMSDRAPTTAYPPKWIDPKTGLTLNELRVGELLRHAFDRYGALPVMHETDVASFVESINRCVDLLAIRVVRRDHPEGWTLLPTEQVAQEPELPRHEYRSGAPWPPPTGPGDRL